MSKILLHLIFCCALAIATIATFTRYRFDKKKTLKEDAQPNAKYDSYKRGTTPFGLIASSQPQTLAGDVAREENSCCPPVAYWKEIAAHVITYSLQENALDRIEHNPAHLTYFEIDLPPPFRS